MTAVAGADTLRLRRVFELERDRGCDNKAVMGGLDRMLIQMAEDGLMTTSSPLGIRFKALPRAGYRSLPEDERRSWVEATIAALSTTPSFAPPSPAKKPATAAPPSLWPRALSALTLP